MKNREVQIFYFYHDVWLLVKAAVQIRKRLDEENRWQYIKANINNELILSGI